jgi:hypothetical protein
MAWLAVQAENAMFPFCYRPLESEAERIFVRVDLD